MSPARTLTTLALALLASGAVTSAARAACPLDRAEYKDTTERGFQLSLAPSRDSGVPLAVAEIRHARRGRLDRFDIVQANGYPVLSFVRPADKQHKEQSFEAYFFDANLRPYDKGDAPPLIFVAGLGLFDHYRARDQVPAAQLLADGLWTFVSCRR